MLTGLGFRPDIRLAVITEDDDKNESDQSVDVSDSMSTSVDSLLEESRGEWLVVLYELSNDMRLGIG